MRALTYHGAQDVRVETVPDPGLQASDDIILRVTATAICGSDLHLYRGKVPGLKDGDILGHEFMGIVEETGPDVRHVKRGDRVVIPFVIACGECFFCSRDLFAACETTNPQTGVMEGRGTLLNKKQLRSGAALFGYTHLYGGMPGGQAEFVRVPFADTSTYQVPAGVSDEQILMLADILPTGYEVGVLNGKVQPGDVVAIVGAGPIGLAAIMGSRLFSPAHIIAIDLADSRLEAAKQFGADITINNSDPNVDPVAIVREMTDGLGADVAIEAVGVPATFELTASLIRPGGHIANIGVHGTSATLHLEELWIRNVTITTGLVDTYSTPTLLQLTQGHQLDAEKFVTHHFTLDQFEEAYDVFARAADTGALKVVLTRA